MRTSVCMAGLAALLLGAGAASAEQRSCASVNRQRAHCAMDTCGGVRVGEQQSRSACVEGQSWGTEDGGVWVDKGCSAIFLSGSSRLAADPPPVRAYAPVAAPPIGSVATPATPMTTRTWTHTNSTTTTTTSGGTDAATQAVKDDAAAIDREMAVEVEVGNGVSREQAQTNADIKQGEDVENQMARDAEANAGGPQ